MQPRYDARRLAGMTPIQQHYMILGWRWIVEHEDRSPAWKRRTIKTIDQIERKLFGKTTH